MPFLLFCAVTLLFLFSLLPFMFPGSLIGLLGSTLDAILGEALAPLLPGWAVGGGRSGTALTLEGTLAVYLPVLAIVYLFMRKGH